MTELYVHPNPTETILPHLLSYLPHSACLAFIIAHATKTRSTLLATFSPTNSPPSATTRSPSQDTTTATTNSGQWAIAALDPPNIDPTRLWIWMTTPESDSAAFAAILARVAALCPDLDSILIGALDARAAVHLPTEPGAVPYFTRWAQLAFTPDALPPPKLEDADKVESKGGYTLGPVREEMYDDVLAGSTIARTHDSLRAMPSGTAAVSNSDGRALAWCFTLRHGAVGALYVRPDARGRGLARATLGSELARAFDSGRAAVLTEVAEGNGPSMGVCEALGAKRIGEVVWARVVLERYRAAAAETSHVY